MASLDSEGRDGSIIPLWFPLLTTTISIIFLIIPKTNLRTFFVGLLICLLHVGTFSLVYPRQRQLVPKLIDEFSLACVLSTWTVSTVDFLILSNPRQDFLRDGEQTPMGKRDSKSLSLWDWVKWACLILISARGVGWNWKVKNVPTGVPKGYPKWKFVLEQLVRSGNGFILEWALISYGQSLRPGKNPTMNLLTNEPLYQQIICGWVLAFRLWAGLSKAYHAFAAFSVAIGTTEPYEWLPPFGNWGQTYTIRDIWGSTWHQSMRRMLTTWGNAISRKLELRKGSFASRYVQLFTAFILSGFNHAYGGYLLTRTSDMGCWVFFISQAVAIFIEDHVIDAAKAVGIKTNQPMWRALERLWTFAWFSYSLTLFAREISPHGLFSQ